MIKLILQQHKKAILISLSISALFLIIYFGFFYHAHKMPTLEPIEVEGTQVKQSSILIEAHVIGTLSSRNNIQITPDITGQVAKIFIKDGTFVKVGTPLIQLDDAVYQAKYESAKANLNFAETHYHRMLALVKKGAVSQQALDQALADLKGKKALAEESRALYEKMLLTAPFDGTLGKVLVSPGEHVTTSTPIVSLTDTQHLRVEYTLSEKYLAQLKLGQKVTITTSNYPEKILTGTVSFISPTINTEDRTVSVYADIPNDSGLLTPGLFVTVTQSLGSADHVLMIPAISLVATIDGDAVYKVVDGKAVMAPVNIGQRTENDVQITAGLQLNDTIVTSGQQKIKEGMPIKMKV